MVMPAETDLFPATPPEAVSAEVKEPVTAPEAEAAPKAEEPTVESEAAPAEPDAEAAAPPSPEVQALRDDLDATKRRLSTAEGRLRAKGLPEIEELRLEVKRMGREIRRKDIESDEALTDPQKRTSLDELETQETKDQATQDFDKYVRRIGPRILARAGRLELSTEVKADINARWNRAKTTDDVDDVFDYVDDLVEQQTAARLKEATKPPAGSAAKKMTMATAGNRTAASGGSDQELVNRFGRGEAMSTEEMVAAGAAMDKGLLPKPEE